MNASAEEDAPDISPKTVYPSTPAVKTSFRDGHLVQEAPPSLTEKLVQKSRNTFAHFGRIWSMFVGSLRGGMKRPFEWKAIVEQLEAGGVASIGIVTVSSVFIGMVMAVQFAFGLRKFGGMEYTPRVIALSFARELAPTLTAIIVGGRIGAGMAAEVGSMAVTEQIDAIRALGADPLKKLVFPRMIASLIALPLLCAIALVLGVGGAMFITSAQFGIPAPFFLQSAISSVMMVDFASGLFKAPFFGVLIALIGCHFGMITRGGTAGVGMSTTRAVVATSIAIFIADFFLTKLAIAIFN